TYAIGPDEFIYYINSASLFCTDSFHGAVFSILLEKPFIVFERGSNKTSTSMSSRIDTLLSTFKLESRLAKNIDINDEILKVDFTHVQPILKRERNKALNYLIGAFDI
ncbi:polysaccharide pyruvyl transferase family protein, partial [Neobacillus drentensis]|uniref:polysaccharide pyruvyl transferase family protein n=1 Tax=Neobacillus drentensis TaxID=220684 RepID=UPI003001FB4C